MSPLMLFTTTDQSAPLGHAGGHRHPVVAGRLQQPGVADGDPRHVLDGDGLLVVGQPVGRTPKARIVRSKQPISVGIVRSQHGILTRKLDHANQAQNNTVRRPPTFGPSPQSHWAHMPVLRLRGRVSRAKGPGSQPRAAFETDVRGTAYAPRDMRVRYRKVPEGGFPGFAGAQWIGFL